MHINAFSENPSTKLLEGQAICISTMMKEKFLSLFTKQKKYVIKRDLDDDSDGSHLRAF